MGENEQARTRIVMGSGPGRVEISMRDGDAWVPIGTVSVDGPTFVPLDPVDGLTEARGALPPIRGNMVARVALHTTNRQIQALRRVLGLPLDRGGRRKHRRERKRRRTP